MPGGLLCHQHRHRFPFLSTHRKSPNPQALIMGSVGMKAPGGARCPQRSRCAERNRRIPQEQAFASSAEELPREKWTFPRAPRDLWRDTGPLPVGESSCPILVEAAVSMATPSNTWVTAATPRYHNMPHPIHFLTNCVTSLLRAAPWLPRAFRSSPTS